MFELISTSGICEMDTQDGNVCLGSIRNGICARWWKHQYTCTHCGRKFNAEYFYRVHTCKEQ